jgi:hypothetical protein
MKNFERTGQITFTLVSVVWLTQQLLRKPNNY